MTTEEKFNVLKDKLKQMDRVIIAFSGGVDSTFLLKTASVSGLSDILAVTGVSESLPEEELEFAKKTATLMNMKHKTIVTKELLDKNYSNNPSDRCYYCKKELFNRMREIAGKEDYNFILDGTNFDDARDWRPGRQAADEIGVISPLLEAGLSKKEIRELSKTLGLPTWSKPATPCLSSRFPYGYKITSEALDRVNNAEAFLKKFQIKEFRVRCHAELARIEVIPEDFPKIINDPAKKMIIDYFMSLGFKYVTIDLQGFRSGSSNELLKD